ncbi:MAG: 5'-methylthioadenosine/adenosylhomocysteine nucleosidase [Clostridia bacterium]|nr:5'-methylthioadenosine/adenosylhomocysteine nucleosidase [Clostridia bacterium]
MTGIIAAMEAELSGLVACLEQTVTETVSGRTFYSGRLLGKDAVMTVCGIGKVNAAVCAEAMILKYHPSEIINTGVGGALKKGVRLLDTVVASYAVQHDADTTALGDPKGLVSTVNLVRFPTDEALGARLVQAIGKAGGHAVSGGIATGDQFVSSAEVKSAIVREFDCAACDMEGAAIAHVCFLNGVKCAILRSISDGADEDANLSYTQFMEAAAQNSVNALKQFFI